MDDLINHVFLMKKNRLLILFFTFILFYIFLSPMIQVRARTLNVPTDYATINEALATASSGDTIYLIEGTYYEKIIIEKSITIKGENKDKVTICGVDDWAINISSKATHVKIEDISFIKSGRAISSQHNGNLILNNVIINNNKVGLDINAVELVILNNVIFSNNTMFGLKTYCIRDLSMKNCVFLNNDRDVYFNPPRYYQYNIDIDKSNTFNGKYFYLLKNKSYYDIPFDAASVALINCNNIDVKNLSIYNASLGIYLHECSNISVEDNELINCDYGINIYDSNYIKINNNKLSGNSILLEGNEPISLSKSYENIISNNVFYSSSIRINFSRKNTIKNNTFESTGGINIFNSNNNIINSNIIKNSSTGLLLIGTTYNLIFKNDFKNNQISVHLKESFNNEIHENNFFKNKINIVSEKVVNQFDKNQRGNYWDDFISEDKNNDGILDTAYIIDSFNKDNFPLASPYEPSSIKIDKTSVTNNRCNIGSIQRVGLHAIWNYNLQDTVGCTIKVEEMSDDTPSTDYFVVTDESGWAYFDVRKDTIGQLKWIVKGVSCGNVVLFEQLVASPQIILDNIRIDTPNSQRIDVNKVTFLYRAYSCFDGEQLQVNLQLNDTLSKPIGKFNYRIVSITEPKYGLTAFTANEFSIIYDRVNITLMFLDTRIDVSRQPEIEIRGVYEYDNSPYRGQVTVSSIQTVSEPGLYSYAVTSINDAEHGLTAFTCNQLHVIHDLVKVYVGSVSSQETRAGEEATIYIGTVYAYDEVPFTGVDGVIYLNDEAMEWSEADNLWVYKVTSGEPDIQWFTITGVLDHKYGLTSVHDVVGSQKITWVVPPFWETPIGVASIGGAVLVVAAAAYLMIKRRG